MTLTADLVATAIVAACRETGDDPVACASGARSGGPGKQGVRARHYAMHALAELFPPRPGFPEDRSLIARLCGVRWGSGEHVAYSYFSTSLSQVFAPFKSELHPEQNAPHFARWFDDVAYERVRASLRKLASAARPGTKLVDAVTLRRVPVPPELCENQVGVLMGDPSPGRSALGDYVEREARRLAESVEND